MPTYGYRCPKCSNEFEVWQTMRDDPGAPCPSCGAPANRMFFPAGIVFKGSGFYKTDSRGAASSAIMSDSGDSGPSGKSSKSSDKGSDNGASGSKSDAGKADSSTTPSSSETSTTTKKAASTDTAG